MLLNPFIYHAPKTLKEAVDLYPTLKEVRILAGGTFLLNNLKALKKRGLKTPQNILSLKKIDELKGIFADKEKLVIKSMSTISELINSPQLNNNFSILKIACRNIATNPIRNMATVGGNLTSRYTWTELGAVFMALEAQMNFMGPGNKKEVVSAEEFFNKNAKTDKILESISIMRDKKCLSVYRRVKKLSNVDIPLLAVCIRTTFKKNNFTNTRVVINNGTAFAQRDLILEEFLNNSTDTKDIADEAIDHLDTKIYDLQSSDYKKSVFRVTIKNALKDLIARKRK